MTAPALLGIDIGTSSCRAALWSPDGQRLGGIARVRYHPDLTPDGGATLDPDALVAAVLRMLDRLPLTRPVAAVGLATFWHSLLGIGRDGRPVTPLLLWLDRRSDPDAEQLRAQFDSAAIHARTGCPIHSSYWPAKLHWLRRTHPAAFAAAARWCSFGDYLAEQLTGQCGGTSRALASATGLFDQTAGRWDPDLCAAVGVAPDQLPPVVSPAALAPLLPPFAARWPAVARIPWLPASGDGAASNVGAGCLTPDRLTIMVGTSAAARVAWRGSAAVAAGLWRYQLDDERVILGGALNDGGSLLDWLRRTLRLPRRAALEEAVAAFPPTAHQLTVLPAWGGERSPRWRLAVRGALLGARLETTPIAIYRAALEAIALQLGRIVALLDAALSAPVRTVVATGSALLGSPALQQILADVIGRPLQRSAVPEASSRGAALLAAERVGLLRTPLDALPPPVDGVIEPIAARAASYREALARLIAAERALEEAALIG
ncbi:MAG: gluconokinase [Chloroflexota bacterium]|nr:gluconokinase [Dehalococcoidia bacterium]MDW8252512.1 gluconokinase [Chloroflexota bacterium]